MNTPTPTPRTDMATYPADCLGTTLVTNRDCSRALERELAALTTERDAANSRAERAEAELATAKERLRSEAMDDYAAIKDLQRELATERGKLDWIFRNCKVIADGYAIHDREDLGVAMQEAAK